MKRTHLAAVSTAAAALLAVSGALYAPPAAAFETSTHRSIGGTASCSTPCSPPAGSMRWRRTSPLA